MNKEQQEEQSIIEKLRAQKSAVKPQQALLSKIIAQLPASSADGPADTRPKTFGAFMQEQRTLTWIRLAIPAGVALLVGGIFFGIQFLQTPDPAQQAGMPNQQSMTLQQTQQPLSMPGIQAEQKRMEQQLTYEDFFTDEFQMQEIDSALASF